MRPEGLPMIRRRAWVNAVRIRNGWPTFNFQASVAADGSIGNWLRNWGKAAASRQGGQAREHAFMRKTSTARKLAEARLGVPFARKS